MMEEGNRFDVLADLDYDASFPLLSSGGGTSARGLVPGESQDNSHLGDDVAMFFSGQADRSDSVDKGLPGPLSQTLNANLSQNGGMISNSNICSLTPGQRAVSMETLQSPASQADDMSMDMSSVENGASVGGGFSAHSGSTGDYKAGQAAGSAKPQHSHLAQQGPSAGQGSAGARSKVVGQNSSTTNMATSRAQMGSINGSSMGRWDEVARRMVLITLPSKGRPYNRADLEDAVIRTKFPTDLIETFGEFERNFKYQMTIKDENTARDFVSQLGHLVVVNDKGRHICPVTLFKEREYRIRVSWYPDAGSDNDLAQPFRRWGQVTEINREKISGKLGRYFSGARIVTLVPSGDIEDVPDFLDVTTMGKTFTCRLVVKGLAARCHLCKQRGHVMRNCMACRRCRSLDHTTGDHPQNQQLSFAQKAGGRDTIMEYGEGDDDKEGEMFTGEPAAEMPVQPASEVAKKPQQSPAVETEKSQGKRGGEPNKTPQGPLGENQDGEGPWQEVKTKHKKIRVNKPQQEGGEGVARLSSQDSERSPSQSPARKVSAQGVNTPKEQRASRSRHRQRKGDNGGKGGSGIS